MKPGLGWLSDPFDTLYLYDLPYQDVLYHESESFALSGYQDLRAGCVKES